VFAQKLRELGYIEGRNIIVEYRIATGMHERLPEFADEMAGRTSMSSSRLIRCRFVAAIKATKTIPIVIRTNVDPVAAGMVASLARPGGNVTGVSASIRSCTESAWNS
jgi:putative ABC transport system substrate-binding protein